MASSFGDGTSRLRGTRGAADAPCDNGGIRERYQHTGRYRNTRRELSYGQGTRGGIQTAPWFGILCHTRGDRPAKTGSAAGSLVESAVEIYADYLGLAVTALTAKQPPGTGHNDRNNSNCHNKNFPGSPPVILSLNRRPNTGMFSLEAKPSGTSQIKSRMTQYSCINPRNAKNFSINRPVLSAHWRTPCPDA